MSRLARAGSDACQGDSGSPLFRLRPTWDLAREDVFEEEEEEEEGVEARRKFRKRYELLGVTSFGARCGQVGVPGESPSFTRCSQKSINWHSQEISRLTNNTRLINIWLIVANHSVS